MKTMRILGLALALAAASGLALGSIERAAAQVGPGPAAGGPVTCLDCPVSYGGGGPLKYHITAHLFPQTAEGSPLWWYDGSPSQIKYAPVLVDIYYSGACGGLGQPACVYHFVSTENGKLSTRNPTPPTSFNCVIESYPADYDVHNWNWLGGGCGNVQVPQPCWDPNYQNGVMTSHFTDTDLNLWWLARLGDQCADGCAYFDRIVLTSADPQAFSSGLRATDPLITCPVYSAYSFVGGTSVTVTRAEFFGYPIASDGTPCEGSTQACVPYRFTN